MNNRACKAIVKQLSNNCHKTKKNTKKNTKKKKKISSRLPPVLLNTFAAYRISSTAPSTTPSTRSTDTKLWGRGRGGVGWQLQFFLPPCRPLFYPSSCSVLFRFVLFGSFSFTLLYFTFSTKFNIT